MNTLHEPHDFYLACARQKEWQREAAVARLIHEARKDQRAKFLPLPCRCLLFLARFLTKLAKRMEASALSAYKIPGDLQQQEALMAGTHQ